MAKILSQLGNETAWPKRDGRRDTAQNCRSMIKVWQFITNAKIAGMALDRVVGYIKGFYANPVSREGKRERVYVCVSVSGRLMGTFRLFLCCGGSPCW